MNTSSAHVLATGEAWLVEGANRRSRTAEIENTKPDSESSSENTKPVPRGSFLRNTRSQFREDFLPGMTRSHPRRPSSLGKIRSHCGQSYRLPKTRSQFRDPPQFLENTKRFPRSIPPSLDGRTLARRHRLSRDIHPGEGAANRVSRRHGRITNPRDGPTTFGQGGVESTHDSPDRDDHFASTSRQNLESFLDPSRATPGAAAVTALMVQETPTPAESRSCKSKKNGRADERAVGDATIGITATAATESVPLAQKRAGNERPPDPPWVVSPKGGMG